MGLAPCDTGGVLSRHDNRRIEACFRLDTRSKALHLETEPLESLTKRLSPAKRVKGLMGFFWSAAPAKHRLGWGLMGALLLLPMTVALAAQELPQQGVVGEFPQQGEAERVSDQAEEGKSQQGQVGYFPQQPQAGQVRDLRLTVETDRKTYRAGDSVAVRLSLTNVSAATVPFVPQPPWALAALTITRNGQVLPRGTFGAGADPAGPQGSLPPKETRFWNWQGHLWFSLRHWGYDLRQPGQYTIAAILRNDGAALKRDGVGSSQATFTILP